MHREVPHMAHDGFGIAPADSHGLLPLLRLWRPCEGCQQVKSLEVEEHAVGETLGQGFLCNHLVAIILLPRSPAAFTSKTHGTLHRARGLCTALKLPQVNDIANPKVN